MQQAFAQASTFLGGKDPNKTTAKTLVLFQNIHFTVMVMPLCLALVMHNIDINLFRDLIQDPIHLALYRAVVLDLKGQ
jgi:hypothetical protein